MDFTLSNWGHLLHLDKTPLENFHAVQTAVMRAGSPWLPALDKNELGWVGDKKPFQHADPRLVDFILQNLPDARFLHLVRHPFAVAASSERFNRTGNGDFWKQLSYEEKIERWVFHEEQVLELKRRVGDQLIDIRYEELCEKPGEETAKILSFLELDLLSVELAQSLERETFRPSRRVSAARCSERCRAVAAVYGYSLPEPAEVGRLAAFWHRLAGRA